MNVFDQCKTCILLLNNAHTSINNEGVGRLGATNVMRGMGPPPPSPDTADTPMNTRNCIFGSNIVYGSINGKVVEACGFQDIYMAVND